jgi:hypothetical protein
MIRSTITRLMALAGLSAAWAFPATAEPRCPSTHTPGKNMVCDLLNFDANRLELDAAFTKRFALPLNTTIDGNALPTYSVLVDLEYFGEKPNDLGVTLSMVDGDGNHAIALGDVRSGLITGAQRVRLDARAQRFAQPAYLSLTIEQLGESSIAPRIRNIRVVQSMARNRDR